MIPRHDSRIEPCILWVGHSLSKLTFRASTDGNVLVGVDGGESDSAQRICAGERDQRHGDYIFECQLRVKQNSRFKDLPFWSDMVKRRQLYLMAVA
jgi:hypothetical protein